jgi:purine-nucleoside phosphorylase
LFGIEFGHRTIVRTIIHQAARGKRGRVRRNPLTGVAAEGSAAEGAALPASSAGQASPSFQAELSSTSLAQEAAARLRALSALRPSLALVLGSGFQGVLDELAVDAKAPYRELPGFPPVGVSGHAGELLLGRLGGTPVLVLSGRAHFYEGHPLAQVSFAVRALAAYGIGALLLTNAAGGINARFRAGDLMVVEDHINLMGDNPLRGPGGAGLNRFIDLSRAYDSGLRQLLRQAARQCGLKLRSGVYLALSGPSYETPAEIRAFARLGADAVGMSTVPEVIVARQCGLRAAALSCITNLAAGRARQALAHAEVLDTAERMKRKTATLLKTFASLYGQGTV